MISPRPHQEDADASSTKPAPLSSVLTREHIIKLLIGFGVVFLVATICGVWFKEPIGQFAQLAVHNFGLTGLFGFVLAIDSVPTPFSYAPIMLLAIEGGIEVSIVFVVSSLASMSGGLIGYSLGRLIGLPKGIEAWLQKNHPEQFILLKRYGAHGVALVAALPLPFALGTWTAGAMRVRLGGVLIASLVRIPKTAFYIILITAGLSVGGN